MSMITEQVERLRTLADITKDIADNSTDTVKTLREAADTIEQLAAKVRKENGFIFPENPTNGDMIKALFPCLEKYEYEELYTHGIALAGNDNRVTWFANEWWNAPYKRGETE